MSRLRFYASLLFVLQPIAYTPNFDNLCVLSYNDGSYSFDSGETKAVSEVSR